MTVTPRLNSWTRYEKDPGPPCSLATEPASNLWGRVLLQEPVRQRVLHPAGPGPVRRAQHTNFEQVLECIHHAKLTEDALGTSTKMTVRLYDEVRDALFSEVTDSHVEWSDMTTRHFQATADAVRAHSRVFTTNYDLTLYWSMLQGAKRSQWADQFWNTGAVFDRHNVAADNDPRTLLYYLHGAVHLWRNKAGTCGKWTSDQTNLLSVLSNYTANSDRQPMFVSEGTSKRKLASIRRSEYLTFCLTELEYDDANTVVFGHSLGREDQHVLTALNLGPSGVSRSGCTPSAQRSRSKKTRPASSTPSAARTSCSSTPL